MRKRAFAVISFALMTASGPTEAQEQAKKITPVPSDIVTFIGHRSRCNDIEKEKPKSAADLDKTRLALRCDSIADEEAGLRQKYKADQEALTALKGTWVRVIQRVPVTVDK